MISRPARQLDGEPPEGGVPQIAVLGHVLKLNPDANFILSRSAQKPLKAIKARVESPHIKRRTG
jgi:hypothetical protein